MNLRFTLSDVAKGFVDTIVKEMQRPIAKAATAAIREADDIAKRNGRAGIAAAGFSRNGKTRCASTSTSRRATACARRRSSLTRFAMPACSKKARSSAASRSCGRRSPV
jgi:hypothetical protein